MTESYATIYADHSGVIWIILAALGLLQILAVFLYLSVDRLRRIEASLRQSEASNRELNRQLQTLLDGIPDHLMLVAPDMHLLWMNRAARAFAGHTEACQQPMLCYHEWPRRDSPCPHCPVRECLATGRGQETVMQVGDRTFGVKAFPLMNEQGAVESVIKLAIDISDKVKAREDADRNNRLSAVGELSAGVAHEINNPTGLILSNLATISDAFEDVAPILDDHYRDQGDFSFGGLRFSRMREQFPALLKETGEAARRIRQIVEDLKSFARGGDTLDISRFALEEAIQRSIRLTGNLLRQATQSFTLDLAPETIMVHGSERRVEQVLVNLLANACQSLPERSRAIVLTTRYDRDQGMAVIILRDEGHGISKEHLAKLATPFFTTRKAQGGTGLGLSVSFGIIKEHNGSISFDSESGKGTTVTVTLPASILEDAP